VRIAGRTVGDGHPAVLVAEAGVNHNGDLGLARRLVRAARDAGADAVKFQTVRARSLASSLASTAPYQACATGGASQREMLASLELSWPAHRALAAHARRCGIAFLSTPFDPASVDLLVRLGVPAIKVASPDVVDLPLLQRIGRTRRPVILSTGMATLGEIEQAVEALRRAGCRDMVLLQATSAYPTPVAEVNLRAMQTLRSAFGVPVGLSDHTEGIDIACAAVALGACLIEKHFTLDRSLPGPDHRASLVPEELAALVRSVRRIESAMGSPRKEPTRSELVNRPVVRKSLCAARPLARGSRLRSRDVVVLRPGTGLAPGERARVLGRRLARELAAGEPIRREDLDG
jgi:N-acetylneuraminate synthase